MYFKQQCGLFKVKVHLVKDFFDLIVEGPNDVGTGNRIKQYNDLESANVQGKRFADNFNIALDEGYSLSDRFFSHPDGRRIHLSNALDTDRTTENFRGLLKQGEDIKPFYKS